jgi:Tol biopolymer transport system component
MKKTLAFIMVCLCVLSCKKQHTTTPSEISLPTTVSIFRPHGLDVSWDLSGSNRIAYSMKESDTYYDVHLTDPDGNNDVCLTCNSSLLPNKHICCPYWHPSGKWLMLVVEQATHAGSSTDALPGFGAYCDIWIMNHTGTKAYKIVSIPSDMSHGVIAPRFSQDGKQIVWTDRKTQPNAFSSTETAGYWTIKIADFAFGASDSIPVVSNIRTIEPVANAFYECYGFSPDNSRLIFCSNMNKPSFFDEHIYTIDTTGNNLVQLTTKDYNEHAFYKPDGSKIVWMSNAHSGAGGTDWWMMNPDGSGKERLTYFNESENTQYAGKAVWAGLGAFDPNGSRFVGGRQVSLVTQEGEIMMVNIK